MIYAYCRVSTPHQRLERQITNITELYPKATIFREFYTGTTQNRPNWERLMTQIKKEDTIVFDSVSRMSRNAAEGFKDYKMLYESGVNLIFLNEPLINTSVFDSTKNNLLNINIETGNTAVDDFFKGNVQLINNFMMALAEQQIKAAFEQSEKEVTDLHSRISQGMREAKKNGVKIGLPQGTTLTTKKALACTAIIKKHSKDFGGSLDDLGHTPVLVLEGYLCGFTRLDGHRSRRIGIILPILLNTIRFCDGVSTGFQIQGNDATAAADNRTHKEQDGEDQISRNGQRGEGIGHQLQHIGVGDELLQGQNQNQKQCCDEQNSNLIKFVHKRLY